ncbi:MAG: hypothetical protein M1820_007654 [Bogoriella megaspora]|nr:MAG: hypothetical protein M1820_007654 [Bogoriella megaspora]
MASIFTYDPDPPRVASPWANSGVSTPSERGPQNAPEDVSTARDSMLFQTDGQSLIEVDNTTTRLEPEPQEGPIEYKLHLSLLPQQAGIPTLSTSNVSGSNHSKLEKPVKAATEGKHENSDVLAVRSTSESHLSETPISLTPYRSYQQRLEQLTTQLLWRLQQSSPYHASTAVRWTPPTLLSDDGMATTPRPSSLVPGLEESKGALYEIGVTDDGTLVGLTQDVMIESLGTLRKMAASLGCTVEVVRVVCVGEVSVRPTISNGFHTQRLPPSERLWVAEAFVNPDLSLCISQPSTVQHSPAKIALSQHHSLSQAAPTHPELASRSSRKQLRISLTGATMSGKSSLLGTLTTGTLDNGRGKSRLSLLKHKHELASGVTSSIAQELVGYCHAQDRQNAVATVVNYETGNVSSWNDIHATTDMEGRLALLTDCAGNPRYRRTAMRGLIGWAPHWTLLCVPADDDEDTSGKAGGTPTAEEALGPVAADLDLSGVYLDLCLRLVLPFVIVITKYDLASKQGLRQTLAKIVSSLKAANRKPVILRGSLAPIKEEELSSIPDDALTGAPGLIDGLERGPQDIVPIVLSSALNGAGIQTLHALLRDLPIPSDTSSQHSIPIKSPSHETADPLLFHVEDEYHNNLRRQVASVNLLSADDEASIVGGYLQYGKITIGDELVLGPYPMDGLRDDPEDSDNLSASRIRPAQMTTSRSFPGALHRDRSFRMNTDQEWRRVRVASIRNLRLPVRSLLAGQVGTLGIVPVSAPISSAAMAIIRRGMVLAKEAPRARHSFVAKFARRDIETLAVGSPVLVYIASVRASAKIVAARMPDEDEDHDTRDTDVRSRQVFRRADDDGFGFGIPANPMPDLPDDNNTGDDFSSNLLVTFRFDHSREFIETGAQVLIMEAGGGLYGGDKRGGKGAVGLDGFVGIVVEGSS